MLQHEVPSTKKGIARTTLDQFQIAVQERIKQVGEQYQGETSNSDSDEYVYTAKENAHDTSSYLSTVSDFPVPETVNTF